MESEPLRVQGQSYLHSESPIYVSPQPRIHSETLCQTNKLIKGISGCRRNCYQTISSKSSMESPPHPPPAVEKRGRNWCRSQMAATSGRIKMMSFLVLRRRPPRVAGATVPSNPISTHSEDRRSLGPARGKQSRSDDVKGVWLGVADSGDGGKGAAAAADTPPAG